MSNVAAIARLVGIVALIAIGPYFSTVSAQDTVAPGPALEFAQPDGLTTAMKAKDLRFGDPAGIMSIIGKQRCRTTVKDGYLEWIKPEIGSSTSFEPLDELKVIVPFDGSDQNDPRGISFNGNWYKPNFDSVAPFESPGEFKMVDPFLGGGGDDPGGISFKGTWYKPNSFVWSEDGVPGRKTCLFGPKAGLPSQCNLTPNEAYLDIVQPAPDSLYDLGQQKWKADPAFNFWKEHNKIDWNDWSDFTPEGGKRIALASWADYLGGCEFDMELNAQAITIDFPLNYVMPGPVAAPAAVEATNTKGFVLPERPCALCLWSKLIAPAQHPAIEVSTEKDALDQIAHFLVEKVIAGKSQHKPVYDTSRSIGDTGVSMFVGTTCDTIDGKADRLCRFELRLVLDTRPRKDEDGKIVNMAQLTIDAINYGEAKRQGSEPPRLTEVVWTSPGDKERQASEDWLNDQLIQAFKGNRQQVEADLNRKLAAPDEAVQ